MIGNIQSLILAITFIVKMLIPLVAGIAFIVFLYGLGQFVLHAGESDAREEGRRLMIWGLVGLFVMFSVWGLVFFFAQTFGVGMGGILPTGFN